MTGEPSRNNAFDWRPRLYVESLFASDYRFRTKEFAAYCAALKERKTDLTWPQYREAVYAAEAAKAAKRSARKPTHTPAGVMPGLDERAQRIALPKATFVASPKLSKTAKKAVRKLPSGVEA